jgi:hypothetical protein
MRLWRKKRNSVFQVVVHLNGRHPYLESNELDYKTRDVTLCVPASDWNDAERQALNVARTLPFKWSCHVKSIFRGAEPTNDQSS